MTVRVSDHAVLRYMERVQGFDVEAVRAHIASLCAGAAATGASTVIAEGKRFEISRIGVVMTVAPRGRGPALTRLARCAARPAP